MFTVHGSRLESDEGWIPKMQDCCSWIH